jgi:UDP-GlcNAc:undecaprenyl-phosphate GlcNAc-1-phosphate transferase
VFVTVTRVLAGRPISVGGRDHTSHRLVALGLSEASAVYVLCGIAAASGAIAYFTYRFGLSRTAVLVLLLALSVSMLAVFLSRAQAQHPSPEQPRPALLRVMRDLSSMRQVAMLVLDFVLVIAAYHGAYLLRFEGHLGEMEGRFLESVPIVVACQLLALTAHRTYQGLWRYTTLVDLVRLVRASSVGTLLALACVVLLFRFEGHSRSVFVIDWLLLSAFLCGSRMGFRLLGEVLRRPATEARRVLVYGAGDAGEMAARQMTQDPLLARVPVGFLDDDPGKWRRHVRGLPVFGGAERIAAILASETIDEVVVASEKIPDERLREVAAACEERGVPVVRASLRLDAAKRVA